MKIISIRATGLPLFKAPLEISFYAQQRVTEQDKMTLSNLCPPIYMNNANAFIGINASGKTSVLKVISLAIGILNNGPINHYKGADILGKTSHAEIYTVFYAKPGKVCRLLTVIAYDPERKKYVILEESLWEKDVKKIVSKKHLTDFSQYEPVSYRQKHESYLPDDVSFIIARNKKEAEHVNVNNLGFMTDENHLPYEMNVPEEIISFLDPSIENIRFEDSNDKTLIFLKFYGRDEIVLNSGIELENYLSSGTIKGIVTFIYAKEILENGGYLLVDEIENHFNREIVATLIRLFMDVKLNVNGSTLIFTTHYPELLDEYDRNDAIHIVRNRDGITAENLSRILKRNDIKKSDAYESGFLEGTTPTYDAYIQLKKHFQKSIVG